MISLIVLTKNEESDLPACLHSVNWCDDIHIVDSGSTDSTITVANDHGCNLYSNAFISFAQQRNWALRNCNISYDWILFLDADERSTDNFKLALFYAINSCSADTAGFYLCGKTILDGRWLKKSDNFPKWQFRLLRKNRASFVDVGHGQKEGIVHGSILYISTPYLHYPFSHGLKAWRSKHNGYAIKDAYQMYISGAKYLSLFSRHGSIRNSSIKQLARRIPGWPLLRFLYSYILRGGFTEGSEGYHYCRLMLWYEYQVQTNYRSLHSSPPKQIV